MPMTKKQVADFLGVSIRTVEGYIQKGKLTPGKAKGTRGDISVFDEEQVRQLKEERGEVQFIPGLQKEKPAGGSSALVAPLPVALAEQSRVERERFIEVIDRLAPPVRLSEKHLLSIPEAAMLSGIPAAKLRAAVKSGKLKAIPGIGRGLGKVRRADLDAYVRKL